MVKKEIKHIEHIKRNFDSSITHRKRYDGESFRCEIYSYCRDNEFFAKASDESFDYENSVKKYSTGNGVFYLVSPRGEEVMNRTVLQENSSTEEEASGGEDEEDTEYEYTTDDSPLIIKKTIRLPTKADLRFDLFYKAIYSEIEDIDIQIQLKIDDEVIPNITNCFNNYFMFSRLEHYLTLEAGDHTVEWSINQYARFFGFSIRQYDTYTGTNDSSGDFIINTADVKLSQSISPDELELELMYTNEMKDNSSNRNKSGYIFDYRDEVNFYVTDKYNTEQQVFGGYVSTVKVDDDLTTLTLGCGGRLVDGNKRLLISSLQLLGGENDATEYESTDELHEVFETKGEAIDYLTRAYETPILNSNVLNNTDLTHNFTHLFDYGTEAENPAVLERFNGDTETLSSDTEDMYVFQEAPDYIILRNGTRRLDSSTSAFAYSEGWQTMVIFSSDNNGDVNISPTGTKNFYIKYGLGEKEYTVKRTTNEDGTTSGSYDVDDSVAAFADQMTSSKVKEQIMSDCINIRYGGGIAYNGYGNFTYSPASVVSQHFANCCDGTRLFFNMVAYKGVPTDELIYRHIPADGRGHVYGVWEDTDYDWVKGGQIGIHWTGGGSSAILHESTFPSEPFGGLEENGYSSFDEKVNEELLASGNYIDVEFDDMEHMLDKYGKYVWR